MLHNVLCPIRPGQHINDHRPRKPHPLHDISGIDGTGSPVKLSFQDAFFDPTAWLTDTGDPLINTLPTRVRPHHRVRVPVLIRMQRIWPLRIPRKRVACCKRAARWIVPPRAEIDQPRIVQFAGEAEGRGHRLVRDAEGGVRRRI